MGSGSCKAYGKLSNGSYVPLTWSSQSSYYSQLGIIDPVEYAPYIYADGGEIHGQEGSVSMNGSTAIWNYTFDDYEGTFKIGNGTSNWTNIKFTYDKYAYYLAIDFHSKTYEWLRYEPDHTRIITWGDIFDKLFDNAIDELDPESGCNGRLEDWYDYSGNYWEFSFTRNQCPSWFDFNEEWVNAIIGEYYVGDYYGANVNLSYQVYGNDQLMLADDIKFYYVLKPTLTVDPSSGTVSVGSNAYRTVKADGAAVNISGSNFNISKYSGSNYFNIAKRSGVTGGLTLTGVSAGTGYFRIYDNYQNYLDGYGTVTVNAPTPSWSCTLNFSFGGVILPEAGWADTYWLYYDTGSRPVENGNCVVTYGMGYYSGYGSMTIGLPANFSSMMVDEPFIEVANDNYTQFRLDQSFAGRTFNLQAEFQWEANSDGQLHGKSGSVVSVSIPSNGGTVNVTMPLF